MPTLLQLATEVMVEFGDRDGSNSVQDLYVSWVKDGIHKIYTEFEWLFKDTQFDITVPAGTRTFLLKSGVTSSLRVRSLKDVTNERVLIYKHKHELHAEYKLSTNGEPIFWYIESFDSANEGLKIGLYPVSLVEINLEALIILSPETYTSGDNIPLPIDFNLALKHWVRRAAFLHEDDLEQAALIKRDFDESIILLRRMFTNPSNNLQFQGDRIFTATHQYPLNVSWYINQ